jgi:hypothetical protein
MLESEAPAIDQPLSQEPASQSDDSAVISDTPTEQPVPAPSYPQQPQAEVPQVTSQEEMYRRQLIETQQRLAAVEAEKQKVALEQQALAYQNQMVERGVPEDMAQTLSQQQAQMQAQSIDLQTQAQQALANEQGRYRAALHYGKQYGIEPDALIMYDSPQAMETAAKQSSEISTLKKELQDMKQQQVPVTEVEPSAGPVAGNSNIIRLRDRYAMGESLSQDEMSRLNGYLSG